MRINRRAFLAASAAAATLPSRLRAQAGPVFRPEDFGAKGDGATNDGRAFAALSSEVNRRGLAYRSTFELALESAHRALISDAGVVANGLE